MFDKTLPIVRTTTVSHGGKYVMVFVSGDDDENRVYFTDLEKLGNITGKLPLTAVVNGLESSFAVGGTCIFTFAVCF